MIRVTEVLLFVFEHYDSCVYMRGGRRSSPARRLAVEGAFPRRVDDLLLCRKIKLASDHVLSPKLPCPTKVRESKPFFVHRQLSYVRSPAKLPLSLQHDAAFKQDSFNVCHYDAVAGTCEREILSAIASVPAHSVNARVVKLVSTML